MFSKSDKDRIRIIGAGIGKTMINNHGGNMIGIVIQGSSHLTIEEFTVLGFDLFGIQIQTSDNIIHCALNEQIQFNKFPVKTKKDINTTMG